MNGTETERQLSGGISGVAFLAGNVLCWAAVPVLLRYLAGLLDAWTANGVRYPMAAVVYWPILIVAWRSGSLDRQALGRCVVPSILALGGQILWALAPYYLPASTIGFLMRISLVFALTAAMILFRDERKLLFFVWFHVGLCLTVIGFVVMSVSKLRFGEEVSATGIAIMLGCGLLFGLYGVSVRYFLRGMSPLLGFGIVSHYVSLGTVVAMFGWGDPGDLQLVSGRDWWVLVGSSILGIALGHYFLYAAVARLGAAVTSAAQTPAPFLTMLLAAWFLGESMTRLEWGAGVAMVCGAALLLHAQNRLAATPPHPMSAP